MVAGIFAKTLPKFEAPTGDYERTTKWCSKNANNTNNRTSSFWGRWLGGSSSSRSFEDVLNFLSSHFRKKCLIGPMDSNPQKGESSGVIRKSVMPDKFCSYIWKHWAKLVLALIPLHSIPHFIISKMQCYRLTRES